MLWGSGLGGGYPEIWEIGLANRIEWKGWKKACLILGLNGLLFASTKREMRCFERFIFGVLRFWERKCLMDDVGDKHDGNDLGKCKNQLTNCCFQRNDWPFPRCLSFSLPITTRFPKFEGIYFRVIILLLFGRPWFIAKSQFNRLIGPLFL